MRKILLMKILLLPLFLGTVLGNSNEIYKKVTLQPGEILFFSNYFFKINNIRSEARDDHYTFICDMDVLDKYENLMTSLYPEKRIYFYWKDIKERKVVSEWVNYTFEKIQIVEGGEVPIERIEKIEIDIVFQNYDAQSNTGIFEIKITSNKDPNFLDNTTTSF